MNNNSKKTNAKNKNVDSFEIINPNAAGIDIGADEHWVCVPSNRDKNNVRRFRAFTCDLYEIANWLLKCGVDTVAMESTGVYWIPLFQVLEAKGIEVNLVNARHVKAVPCRAKTDRLDCQWIRKLHACGLLNASFRPPHQICQIRTLVRHRDNLIQMKAKRVLHMQKSLELMNIKLTHVISDILGATGLKIIEAILAGNHDPLQLVLFKDPRIKATNEDIIKALQGDFREEHLFTLQMSLDGYKYIQKEMELYDHKIESFLQRFDSSPVQVTFDFLPNTKPKKAKPIANAPKFDVRSYLQNITHTDLMDIPGIKESALTLISEIGLDMTKFSSAKKFTAWLGLAPNTKISGGKVLSRSTARVRSPAANVFRNAAVTLRNSDSYLGSFYRHIRARSGPAVAVTATARKLAVIVYHMLKNRSPFLELGSDYLSKTKEQKMIKFLKKQAKVHGFSLVPNS